MKPTLDKAYNLNDFRQWGHQTVDMLAGYLEDCMNRKFEKTINWKTPQEQYEFWENDFSEPLIDNPQDLFSKLLGNINRLHNPSYIGHQVTAPLPINALTGMINSLLNNAQAIYEMGPAPTAMEHVIVKWLAKELGMNENADGIITSGGSLGNLTALLAARQIKTGINTWDEGTANSQLAVIVSGYSHYSIARSIKIMGLGKNAIIDAPINNVFQIDIGKLEEVYDKAVADGKQIFALVANACTTATGTYDPLIAIAEFCRKHDLWLHIDGAHGAPAIFSEKYKHLVTGIQLADSVTVDFHKMMMVSALATAVVFKDGKHSYATFAQKADYLLNQKLDWWDIAGRTVECTKHAFSFKIYTILRLYGKQVFTEYIDTTYDLAQEFALLLTQQPDFEIATPPMANIVCFRYIPDDLALSEEEFSIFNRRIRRELLEDGTFYIVQTELRGKTYLRISIMNPLTTLADCKNLLLKIRELYLMTIY